MEKKTVIRCDDKKLAHIGFKTTEEVKERLETIARSDERTLSFILHKIAVAVAEKPELLRSLCQRRKTA